MVIEADRVAGAVEGSVDGTMSFQRRLSEAWDAAGSALCVGLDPIIERMPAAIAAGPRPVLAFNRLVVDTVGDLVCAFKPQFAHHAAVGAEEDLAETIAYIRERFPKVVVILDAKRGDIGSTAEMYVREAFDRYDADAVTVNPYMGDDTVLPFLARPDRGALILCRTSNPCADLVQTADAGGRPVFEMVAHRAETIWNTHGNAMLVTGATKPAHLKRIREIAPTLPFLVPGVGEQGGSATEAVEAGARSDGRGLVVSASRSVLYAGGEAQIRAEAESLHRQLRF